MRKIRADAPDILPSVLGEQTTAPARAEEMKPLFSAPAFARRLNAAMHIRAISLRKAAGQMQVDPGTLHRVKGGTTPSIETYLRIVRWLDAVDAVFDRAIPKPD